MYSSESIANKKIDHRVNLLQQIKASQFLKLNEGGPH